MLYYLIDNYIFIISGMNIASIRYLSIDFFIKNDEYKNN